MNPKFRVGRVIRYGSEALAIMRVVSVKPSGISRPYPVYIGKRINGGLVSVSEAQCESATPFDLSLWRSKYG